MAKVKKAQKGIKASPDSTDYYKRLSKSYFDKANKSINAPWGGRPLREQLEERSAKEDEYYKKAFKAMDNQLRQSRKGKPGYDANGFPIKKRSGGKLTTAKGGKQMLKRADGSVSQRGLWDNIRAAAKRNKAAGKPGKKPTAAMLKQERKIKAKGK